MIRQLIEKYKNQGADLRRLRSHAFLRSGAYPGGCF